jgi:hypothetical protein
VSCGARSWDLAPGDALRVDGGSDALALAGTQAVALAAIVKISLRGA